jgi:drug/metabolite transporter (DMT)-like permease
LKRDIVAIHLAAFLFGMTGILGTLIHADSAVITFGRALFAVLVLTPLLWFSAAQTKTAKPLDKARATRPNDVWRYVVSGGLLAVHWVTFFVSVKAAGVAIATLGFSSFAAFITLIEWIIARGSIKRIDWIRTAVISIGLALITPSIELGNDNTFGFIMGLLSGLSFAAMAVFNSRALTHVNPITVARNQNLIVLLCMAGWAVPELTHVSASSWLWLAVLGIFCTGLSHALFVRSLTRLRVNIAGLVIALEPVYAITVAWLLFHEVPTARTIIGGVIIVAAIIGMRYQSKDS